MAFTLEEIKNFIWKVKDKRRVIKMVDMDSKHLQSAYTHACIKELEYHNLGSQFNLLREQLETVAEKRGLSLKMPDERFPSEKHQQFFRNIRKSKELQKEESPSS